MPHELSLATRQKTKIKNEFANNMSADIKVSKTQKDFVMKGSVPLAKNMQTPLANIASASATDGVIQRMCRRVVEKAEKGITLVTSDEDLDCIIRISYTEFRYTDWWY